MNTREFLRRVIATPGSWLVWSCVLGTLSSGLAWLVNVDVALSYFGVVGGLGLQRILPGRIYDAFAALAVDLSTLSPIIALVVFGVPAWVGLRLMLKPGQPLPSWVSPGWTPYFRGISQLCIGLGFQGTLVGMMFGMPTGVGQGSSVARTQMMLDSLLSGFQTAIVSS